MIKIECIHTCNWEAAIRGMRNPMNSWDKSDSWFEGVDGSHEGYHKIDGTVSYEVPDHNDDVFLGPNDLKLALQLAKAGTDHGKFLRQIIFSCDITAPMYWWKEMDTYKVGTVRNSCSTMHKIMSKEFVEEDFSWDQIIDYTDANVNDFKETTLEQLNHLRDEYLYYKMTPTKDIELKNELIKKYWYTLIQILPSSYNQKATWTANYEVLRNIYHARKNHKLDEWHEFCHMIEKLPYSELITEVREK